MIEKAKSGRVPNVAYFKDTLPSRNNKSGVKGVHWHKGAKKWCAKLTVYGKAVNIGYFDSIAEAERALNKARNEY